MVANEKPADVPEDYVKRCPEYGSQKVRVKPQRKKVMRQDDSKYQCTNTGCYAHFDEPDWGPRRPPRESQVDLHDAN